jgi:RNA polymerase sigma-70 factor (ECF subfamily)
MSNLQQKRDRALARRVASGDHAAFDEFFHEYFPRLYRFTLSRVDNDESLAEEIVQRTLCIVVRKMGTYRGEALLFSWLCQICRSEMSAIFKRLGREARHAMPLEDNPAVQAAMESLSGLSA